MAQICYCYSIYPLFTIFEATKGKVDCIYQSEKKEQIYSATKFVLLYSHYPGRMKEANYTYCFAFIQYVGFISWVFKELAITYLAKSCSLLTVLVITITVKIKVFFMAALTAFNINSHYSWVILKHFAILFSFSLFHFLSLPSHSINS